MNVRLSDTLSTFAEKLQHPRAAFAYGIDTRELRHNAFLHFMLQPPVTAEFSKRLLKEIAGAVHPKTPSVNERRAWNAILSHDITGIHAKCNLSAGRGYRPDEVIHCTMRDNTESVLVVEMKIKAEGGSDQLNEYLTKDVPDAAGLLLRIPGRDAPSDDRFPVLTGRDYQTCIENALPTIEPKQSSSQWLIDDYCHSLDFLDTMDETIIKCGDELWEIFDDKKGAGDVRSTLRAWLGDNWRWMLERIAREVERQWKCEESCWKAVAYSSRDSAAVDFEHETDLKVTSGTDGAYLYLHWKVGSGFEVRVIVKGYGKSPTTKSLTIMDQLCEKARNAVREHWQHQLPLVFPKRSGNSRCVAKVCDSTCSVERIVGRLKELVPQAENVLCGVVADMTPF